MHSEGTDPGGTCGKPTEKYKQNGGSNLANYLSFQNLGTAFRLFIPTSQLKRRQTLTAML